MSIRFTPTKFRPVSPQNSDLLQVRRVPLREGQAQQPTRVVLDRTLRLTAGQPPGQVAVLRDGHSSVVFYSARSEE